jgi:hypothetical protein
MINMLWSPYIVPIAVFVWMAVVGVAKIIGQTQTRRIEADQRMVMLQRGMTPEQIATVLQPARENDDEEERVVKTKDPLRSLANARRAAVVLASIGIGLAIFGFVLSTILQVREVLAVSAAGLIPLAIGIGFFVDYGLQTRELARFGLEVAADQPPNRPPN